MPLRQAGHSTPNGFDGGGRALVPDSEFVRDPLRQLRSGTDEFYVLALLRDRRAYGLELARKLAAADTLIARDDTLYPLRVFVGGCRD